MAKVAVWPTVHAERKALAADLEGLTDEQWQTRSQCHEWTVRDVLAHMTGAAKISPAAFFPRLIASGFSLTKMQAKDIITEKGASPAETLANFKAVANFTKHPPGPTDTWLGEAIVHSEDIRRPLGIKRDYPKDAVAQVADSYKKSNLVLGAKKRIAGLKLQATDHDWSHGAGPEVSGPMISLLMVIAGRGVALDDLSGDGVATLKSRM